MSTSMSFNDFQKQAEKASTFGETENIAITVEGYEKGADGKDYVIGTRSDNGEQIKAYLRDDRRTDPNREKRPEIADFRPGSGHNSSTEVGGSMLLSRAYKDSDGAYNAYWGKSLLKEAGRGVVAYRQASFRVMNLDNADKKPYVVCDTLNTDQAAQVSNMDEAKQALTTMLTPFAPGSHPFAYIRAVSHNDEVAECLVSGQRVQNADGHMVAAPSASSLQKFVESDMGQAVAGLLNSNDVKLIEVIPGQRFFAPEKTKAAIMKKPKYVERTNALYNPDNTPHYSPSIVTIQTYKDSSDPFLSYVEPKTNNPSAYTLKTLPTANYVPKIEATKAPVAAQPKDQEMDDDLGADLSAEDLAAMEEFSNQSAAPQKAATAPTI